MINDSFGFDAGEEVIMAVGDRLAKTLRGTDVIGRTAGNKFGVILKNCSEKEIAVVASRLRAAVRGQAWTRAAAWWRPPSASARCGCRQAASTSQEAMLRAEEALDQARAAGRDGFAAYMKSPQPRDRAAAPDGYRRRSRAGAAATTA